MHNSGLSRGVRPANQEPRTNRLVGSLCPVEGPRFLSAVRGSQTVRDWRIPQCNRWTVDCREFLKSLAVQRRLQSKLDVRWEFCSPIVGLWTARNLKNHLKSKLNPPFLPPLMQSDRWNFDCREFLKPPAIQRRLHFHLNVSGGSYSPSIGLWPAKNS